MRHGKKFNHLGRKKGHRRALLMNLANALIEHKRINTTLAKAKALRVYVEPLITKGKKNTTHSRRVVFSYLQNKYTVTELFGNIASKIGDRPGGYTRVIKTGFRQGDGAEMAMIELVDFNEVYTKAKAGKSKSTRRSRRKKSKSTTKSTETKDTTEDVVESIEETSSEKLKDVSSSIAGSAAANVSEVAEKVEEVKETVTETIETKVEEKVEAVETKVEEVVEKVEEKVEVVEKEVEKVEEKVEEVVEAKVEEKKVEEKKVEIASDVAPDDLTKIEGIGPKIAELFGNAGINTFQKLADADIETLKGILADAGSRYTMHDPTTWAMQSKMAADGKWDELKKWQDESDGGKPI